MKQRNLLFLRSCILFGGGAIDGDQPQIRRFPFQPSIRFAHCHVSLLSLPLMTIFYRGQCNRTYLINKGLHRGLRWGECVIKKFGRTFVMASDMQASSMASKELLGRLEARGSALVVGLFFSALTHAILATWSMQRYAGKISKRNTSKVTNLENVNFEHIQWEWWWGYESAGEGGWGIKLVCL